MEEAFNLDVLRLKYSLKESKTSDTIRRIVPKAMVVGNFLGNLNCDQI